VVLLVDLNGAIEDGEDVFSVDAGDIVVVVESTVLVTGFVELGIVKAFELADGERGMGDILFEAEVIVLATETVGFSCGIVSIVFNLLEDNVDIVDVLGWLDV